MCEVGTSRYRNRSNYSKQNHFLPSLVPPWHFCTISDNPPTTRRYDPCEWCEGFSIDHRWWDWVSWVLWHVSIWDSIPWWWWNTKYHCACHSRCISLLPHWTYPTHPSSSRSVPLLLRSFHLVIEPRVYCHHRSWCESPSWFIFHSSIFCTCSYLQCDNTWVHTRERIESHLTSVLPRLCNQTERKTCFKVFFVSSSPCSWIQATVVFVSHRIHDHSTRIRDIARSMPCFPQSDTYALLWDHQLVYEELFVLVSLLPPLTSYSHPYLVWHIHSWIRNGLIGELPIDHVILGCQSSPGLSANLDHSSSIGVQCVSVCIHFSNNAFLYISFNPSSSFD